VTSHATFVFPPFRLDVANEQLWRESSLIPLRPKTFQFLLYLARNAQRLVTKQELIENIWRDTVVSDELLRGYIRELRETLGDDARKPRYIETVPARGYRFLLRVERETPSSPISNGTEVPPPETKPRKAHDELRVGILHSMTGTMAWTEGPVVDATLLAIEEINGRGGVLGRDVLPVVADGQSEETVFARHAERLIAREEVCTIFGCWTSASRKSVLPIVEKKDHLLVYPTQYEGMEHWRKIVSGMMSDPTDRMSRRQAPGTMFPKTRLLSWIVPASHMAILVRTMFITTAHVSNGLLRFSTITRRPMTWRRHTKRCAANKSSSASRRSRCSRANT
jgi:DNA-binding winged helix-turn-helix (wHTH) protein